MRIDSEGGKFAVAVLIALEMEEAGFPVFTTIVGYAGSAAALLALAGDHRRIDRNNGALMLHYASPPSYETGREMREIVGTYARRAHPRDIATWLALEKTFTPDEAFNAGLVDAIIDARSLEPVRLRLPPKRPPAGWLTSYRELAEHHDLRPRSSI